MTGLAPVEAKPGCLAIDAAEMKQNGSAISVAERGPEAT
jgi:hypothetical protein